MGKPEIAMEQNTQEKIPQEKVIPITDPEGGGGDSSNEINRRPFVLERKSGGGRGNMPLMLVAIGVILVFGVGMIAFLSTKGTTKHKTATEATKPNLGRFGAPTAPGDLVPSDKMKPSPAEATKGGSVDASDIERTKSAKTSSPQPPLRAGSAGNKSLDQVAKFQEPDTSPGDQKWTPPPYGSNNASDQQATKKEEEALSKPSLVFTAHQQGIAQRGDGRVAETGITNLGFAPGYHVAARLEAMATTAVHAPVVAVIEHNYERDGEIIIPAGSRAVGKITQADPSGLMNITFSSIEYASGETVPIEAVAADMSLAAIKGRVTGKQSGKNLMVRSLSGLGETAAMIVGAPSANSAFSENDMLRMRLADNIGNAGDEQIMRMLTMQHIVVSVPAGTEIYLIFAKSQSVPASRENPTKVESASLPATQ
jgi:Bacterial conjugation TrbI-like protein